MTEMLNYLAIDLGASNGRIIIGKVDGDYARLQLIEAHRFLHEARYDGTVMRWDWSHIIKEVFTGLNRAAAMLKGEHIAAVSCDSWAQDFGLLDRNGNLFYLPVSYRDQRTRDIPDRIHRLRPPMELLRHNGGVLAPITTLCQLKYICDHEPEVIVEADKFLHIADLVLYQLCGKAFGNWTLAAASQMMSVTEKNWDMELLTMAGIPPRLCPDIVSDRIIGRLNHPDLATNLHNIPVVSGAGHDTAAAFVAAGIRQEDLFASLGTWAMVGVRLAPTDDWSQLPDNLAVLGLIGQQWGLFRSHAGMWLMQGCVKKWRKTGEFTDYADLDIAAAKSRCDSLIDPADPILFAPSDMPTALLQLCRDSQQQEPKTPGDFARVVSRSIARSLGHSAQQFEILLNRRLSGITAVSGGSRNTILCDAIPLLTGRQLQISSTEASAIGNLITQMAVTPGIHPHEIERLLKNTQASE